MNQPSTAHSRLAESARSRSELDLADVADATVTEHEYAPDQPLGPYVYSVTLTDGTRMHTPHRDYALILVEAAEHIGRLDHYDIAGH